MLKDAPTIYRDFATGWAERHRANLDRWLEGREFVATEALPARLEATGETVSLDELLDYRTSASAGS